MRTLSIIFAVASVVLFHALIARAQNGRDMGCSPTVANPCTNSNPGGSTSSGPNIWQVMAQKRENAAREKLLKEAHEANVRGIAAWNQYDYETAVKEFTVAHAKNPDDVNIAGNLEKAKQALKEQQESSARSAADEAKRQQISAASARTMSASMQNIADSLTAAPATSGLEFGDPSVVDLSKSSGLKESAFFFALQTRTFAPMEGGHPIDADPSKPLGRHALVGGTTWTYGLKWPDGKCDAKCHSDIEASLKNQLKLFCSSEKDSASCEARGLPFTPENYDMVVSMASYHNGFDDLATRVVFDNATMGEYTKTHKEIFASLEGRDFDTLDCHSNGAMLCLAALRGNVTTAKTVRLFGPQISPEAAAAWRDLVNDPKNPIKIEIFINNGDPVPALSWKLPKIAPQGSEGSVEAWSRNAGSALKAVPDLAFNALKDTTSQVMDKELAAYGFKVIRQPCSSIVPSLSCHSMNLYEGRAK